MEVLRRRPELLMELIEVLPRAVAAAAVACLRRAPWLDGGLAGAACLHVVPTVLVRRRPAVAPTPATFSRHGFALERGRTGRNRSPEPLMEGGGGVDCGGREP